MNFFGIGPAELLVIFVIMLIVAGPKRMIVWAYLLGKYIRQMRAMMQETMDAFQREIDASGMTKDIQAAKEAGFDVYNEVSKIINPTSLMGDIMGTGKSESGTTDSTPLAATLNSSANSTGEASTVSGDNIAAPDATALEATASEASAGAQAQIATPPKPDGKDEPRYDAWLPE